MKGGRVQNKIALVVGGGQRPGETIGNGRATAIVLGREGARVVVADYDLSSAEETARVIRAEGGEAVALQVDATSEESVKQLVTDTLRRYGKLQILHNNVGAGGDASATEITEAAFDKSFALNLKSAWFACKHAMPALRESRGSIVNISSAAALHHSPSVGYKTMKTAVISLTQHLAAMNAQYGVRVNAILPGAINTPLAIDLGVAKAGKSREDVIAARDARVPLQRKQGTGWDIAYAALFLHSDEAGFITGIALPVDGGEEAAH